MSDFSFDLTPPARFATLPTLDEDRDEAGSSTIHTHTRTNSLTSISSRPPRPRRAPPPLPPVENGGRLSLISEVDSSVLDTPLPPVCKLGPSLVDGKQQQRYFRQQLEDKFPAPPPTEPAVESDDDVPVSLVQPAPRHRRPLHPLPSLSLSSSLRSPSQEGDRKTRSAPSQSEKPTSKRPSALPKPEKKRNKAFRWL
jgi:hypothetical protein